MTLFHNSPGHSTRKGIIAFLSFFLVCSCIHAAGGCGWYACNYISDLQELEYYGTTGEPVNEGPVVHHASAVDWIEQGDALAANGRYWEAIDAYNQALILDPDDARAWAHIGHALDALGRHPESSAVYHHAIALDPGSMSIEPSRVHTDPIGSLNGAPVLGSVDDNVAWLLTGKPGITYHLYSRKNYPDPIVQGQHGSLTV